MNPIKFQSTVISKLISICKNCIRFSSVNGLMLFKETVMFQMNFLNATIQTAKINVVTRKYEIMNLFTIITTMNL